MEIPIAMFDYRRVLTTIPSISINIHQYPIVLPGLLRKFAPTANPARSSWEKAPQVS